ncbi:MAG: NADH:ubiquinone reductase (Na(+)-transporting) subunit F [Paracoccaceae bacterium]
MTEIILGSLLLTGLILLLTLMVIAARNFLTQSKPATVTVNETTQIDTQTGSKLLNVLSDNGILIPSACAGAGTCGLCRVRVTEGGGEALPTEAGLVSRADLRDGTRLACQVVLNGDLSIEVAEDLLDAQVAECTVSTVRFLTPLIREITLQLPDGVRPDVIAGSFIQITAPAFSLAYTDLDVPEEHHATWGKLRRLKIASKVPVTRAYSISNRPEDNAAGRLCLNIRLALPPPSQADALPGAVSSWLFQLKPGDPVSISGPFGSFRAQDTDREMVFIGGGVGMAPLRAIIFDQLERVNTGRKISYWYGARSKTELFYTDEFSELERQHKNFSWTVALSDPTPQDNWQGATGFVHQVAFERHLQNHEAPEDCEYYLCGPPMMIRAVLAMLDDAGVDKDHIFNDDFGI